MADSLEMFWRPVGSWHGIEVESEENISLDSSLKEQTRKYNQQLPNRSCIMYLQSLTSGLYFFFLEEYYYDKQWDKVK